MPPGAGAQALSSHVRPAGTLWAGLLLAACPLPSQFPAVETNRNRALALHGKGVGSIPTQGTCQECGFHAWLGRIQEASN